MIGIDSISRLNLIRSMPHTAQTLYNTGWFELKGYNKVSLFSSCYILVFMSVTWAMFTFNLSRPRAIFVYSNSWGADPRWDEWTQHFFPQLFLI